MFDIKSILDSGVDGRQWRLTSFLPWHISAGKLATVWSGVQ